MGAPVKTLDRYVLREWIKILLLAELGFPLVVIIIDLTDKLGSYLARGIGKKAIALSYAYYLPEVMFLVLPAAVLFATVFTIGPMGRYSELTAAKASGVSFFRVARPLFTAAAVAMDGPLPSPENMVAILTVSLFRMWTCPVTAKVISPLPRSLAVMELITA